MVKDPVCDMEVTEEAAATSNFEGKVLLLLKKLQGDV